MNVLILFARAPSAPGKTRLTAHLSEESARALREALLLDTLDCARSAGVPLVVAFTPDASRDEVAMLASDIPLLSQRGPDLGERMRNAMHDAFALGADKVALIGSDLPALPSQHVIDAFTMLNDADLVLGPSPDGGFYLIAARQDVALTFEGVEWGTGTVLQQVADAAVDAGLTVGFARPWFDSDTCDDLRRLMHEADPNTAVRTRAWSNLRRNLRLWK